MKTPSQRLPFLANKILSKNMFVKETIEIGSMVSASISLSKQYQLSLSLCFFFFFKHISYTLSLS